MEPIRYLANKQLDPLRWDRCVQRAKGPLFAYSWYLDLIHPGWEALVMGNYAAVMPLTGNKKYGIHYLFQPFLTPQGGIISDKIDKKTVKAFLDSIPVKFRFAEINLNNTNNYSIPGYSLHEKKNYFLSLDNTYDVISSGFNQNFRRNIRKAVQSGCRYETGVPLSVILKTAKKQLKGFTTLRKAYFERFEKLCQYMLKNRKAVTIAVYLDNKLLASAIFFYGKERVYYVLAGNSEAGKPYGASHLLFDSFIRENSRKPLLLDFAGSDHASIARFYLSMGATEEKYPSLKINRLPRLLKWAKR